MQRIFEALSSATRREMLVHLADGERNATDLATKFAMSKSAVSQHLAILETAGLVAREKRGQFVFYTQMPEQLASALTGYLRLACPAFEQPAAKPRKGKKRKKAKKNVSPGKP